MTRNLRVRGNTRLELQNQDFQAAHRVDVYPTIDGRRYQFVFTFNPKFGFYGVEVRDPRGMLDKWYPRPGHEHLIENFNPERRRRSDAIVTILDSTGENNPPTPNTMGERHQVQVLTGRVVR